jgi:hypothetical protein
MGTQNQRQSQWWIFMGQILVFFVLITSKITIPVRFSFYVPDPELTAWNKKNKNLKKQDIIVELNSRAYQFF